MVEALPLTLHVGRRRATVLFWTTVGVLGIILSLLSLLQPVLHLSNRSVQLTPMPFPGVLGALLLLHVQLVYATRLRLELDQSGISFRNLLHIHRVAWEDVQAIDSVSALTLQGRGGNMSALRLKTKHRTLMIPDVFTLHRDALRLIMLHHASPD